MYMAPELKRADDGTVVAVSTLACDAYSVGITIISILQKKDTQLKLGDTITESKFSVNHKEYRDVFMSWRLTNADSEIRIKVIPELAKVPGRKINISANDVER